MENSLHLHHELQKKLNEICPLTNTDGWLSTLILHCNTMDKTLQVTFPHALFGAWFTTQAQPYFEKAVKEVIFSLYAFTPHIKYIYAAKKNSTCSRLTQGKTIQETDFFDEFIYNTKNAFPLSLIKEIAEKPLHAKYNPLTMYGSSSTGKTQILECLKKALLQKHSLENKLFFGTSQDFAKTLEKKGPKEFCQSYQFFMVDKWEDITPIHHLQKECASFLEYCLTAQKQIIFASTVSPEQEKNFADILKDRLNAGLILELKKSDIDVRMRFAMRYSKKLGLKVSKEHILLLAQRCKNISMLRGVLLKIEAFQKYEPGILQDSHMENILLPFSENEKNLRPQDIVSCIATYFEMQEEHILGHKREPDMVRARQMSMFLCRDLLGLSYPAIGKFFNGKDHSTVIYAIKKIKKLTDTNKNMQHMVTEIKKKCLSL